MRVKTLPKNAVYDYTDVCGRKVYHTERKTYVVSEQMKFGRKCVTIESLRKIIWEQ